MKIKALVMTAVLLVASATGAFALRQTSINYSIGSSSFKVKDDDANLDAKMEYGFSPFGLNVDNTWFFGGVNMLQVGFDLDFGFWLSSGQKVDGENDSDWFNLGEYISIGPAFSLAIDMANALRFTPGLQMKIDEAFNSDYTWTDVYAAFSMDFAFQHFFSEDIGLNLGFDMDFPFAGTGTTKYSYKGKTYTNTVDIGSGFDYRIYGGVVFRM
ncbi:MAG: hypothetical protein II811_08800 [Spirochaetaceae bacterium]|nr:hypothetical protein [Spirochaetaceae bacterium]